MSKRSSQSEHSNDTEQEARIAVEAGENVRDAVRKVTLKALSAGDLDMRRIRRVVGLVLHGASRGAQKHDENSGRILRETLEGVDDALAKSAMATKLAIEEAAGRVKDFGFRDLGQSLDDLRALESLFLETAAGIAQTSHGTTKDILGNLTHHARNIGTSTGVASRTALQALTRKLGDDVRDRVGLGVDAARALRKSIAQAAAGFLEGLADTVAKADESDKGR